MYVDDVMLIVLFEEYVGNFASLLNLECWHYVLSVLLMNMNYPIKLKWNTKSVSQNDITSNVWHGSDTPKKPQTSRIQRD